MFYNTNTCKWMSFKLISEISGEQAGVRGMCTFGKTLLYRWQTRLWSDEEDISPIKKSNELFMWLSGAIVISYSWWCWWCRVIRFLNDVWHQNHDLRVAGVTLPCERMWMVWDDVLSYPWGVCQRWGGVPNSIHGVMMISSYLSLTRKLMFSQAQTIFHVASHVYIQKSDLVLWRRMIGMIELLHRFCALGKVMA